MDDTSSLPLPLAPPARTQGRRPREGKRLLISLLFWLFVIGNGLAVLWVWGSGGEQGIAYNWHSFTDVCLNLGRITALLAGYLALIEVLLLARLPALERIVGFDRLTVWHRWNGHAVIDLILAHVVFTVWGYARTDGTSWYEEYWRWLTLPQGTAKSTGVPTCKIHFVPGQPINFHACPPTTSPYPGIITATVGTALLFFVVITSLVIVRRKLSYEWWYAVHFTAYGGIALAWFHMIPDGNDLHVITWARDYWTAIYILAGVLVLWFRLLRPIERAVRFDLKVSEVIHEGPGVVSLRVTGRNLDKLDARAGQFFFWRFFTKGFWYTQHPFSLSEAPDGRSFRITVKNLGDHSAKFGEIPIGTRVFAEGPFGVFTVDARTTDKSLLIAGGIGITPVRALMERIGGDVITLYRVATADDIVFAGELDSIAHARGMKVDYVVGDHATPEGRDLLSPRHLKELVPDITDRDVFICGPVGMIDSIIPSLRAVSVPREHLHIERFAL